MTPVPLRRLVQVFDGPRPTGEDVTTWRAPNEREYHFETADGSYVPRPLVGDCYVQVPHRWCAWTNCDGRHLVVMLPTARDGSGGGHEWSPMNRASNCTLKNDTLHRCWVTHGDPERPETLHVDKDGLTCTAGGGSIQYDEFHGYLSNGFVTTAHERRKWRQGSDGRWWAPNPEPIPHVVVVDGQGRVLDPTVRVALPAHPTIPRDRQRRRR